MLPTEVLHLHLASCHLVTTGTKAAMARWLFDAIHKSNSTATFLSPSVPTATITTATTLENANTITSSSSSTPISIQSGVTSDTTSVQLATLIQLLSQTLQQNSPALLQPSISAAPLQQPHINPPSSFHVSSP